MSWKFSVGFLVLVFFVFPLAGDAATIFLKDGGRLDVDEVWEEDGLVKYRLYGGIIGIPKEKVARLEYPEPVPEKKIVEVPRKVLPDFLERQEGKGFGFDRWECGMSLDIAFDLAEKYDLPLRHGTFGHGDHFDYREKKYIGTENIFSYRDFLLGKSVNVQLYFTQSSRRLHTILIKFDSSAESDFYYVVQSVVCKKYGRPRNYLDLSAVKYIWVVDGKNLVELSRGFMGVELKYIERLLESYDIREKEAIKQKGRQEAIYQDHGKF